MEYLNIWIKGLIISQYGNFLDAWFPLAPPCRTSLSSGWGELNQTLYACKVSCIKIAYFRSYDRFARWPAILGCIVNLSLCLGTRRRFSTRPRLATSPKGRLLWRSTTGEIWWWVLKSKLPKSPRVAPSYTDLHWLINLQDSCWRAGLRGLWGQW